MAMEYFPCYLSYGRILSRLSDQELGRLFRALMEYAATGAAADLPGKESVAFDFITADIDRANANYEAVCQTRRESGKKGGRPKNQMVCEENQKNQMVCEENQKNQMVFEKTKKSQSESKSKSKSNIPLTGDEARACVGAQNKPTLNEVITYCRERRSNVNPQRFYDYWQERGWKGVDDWQARLRSWESNGIDGAAQTTPASYDIDRAEQRAKTAVPELKKRRTEND